MLNVASTRRLARALHAEDGQMVVMTAMLGLFLLAILAIVIESSFIYFQRRDLQNQADAAALAGAQELTGTPDGDAAALAAANQYAADNLSGATVTPVIDDTHTKITVTVGKPAETAFTGWLSFGSPTVHAHATAGVKSFNIIRCVVPLAVQKSVYLDAVNDTSDPPDLVPLKVAVQSGPSGSNTGLVNLGPGNSAGPIRTGLGCGLSPDIPTKPGGTIGDVNNGLTDRLKAAKTNSCYTWADVQPPTVAGATWHCKPENSVQANGTQATAVVLLPVLDTDIVQSGAQNYPLAQLSNGQYLLAYFWVSGDATYDTSGNNWQCLINSGPDKCVIWGRFVLDQPVDLDVFDASQCPNGNINNCVIDYDPAATNKIVQLLE